MQRPDPRTTSVIAGTRLDLLEAMETLERDHPQFVEPLLLRDVYGLPYEEIAAAARRPARHHQGADPPRPQAGAADAGGLLVSDAAVGRARRAAPRRHAGRRLQRDDPTRPAESAVRRRPATDDADSAAVRCPPRPTHRADPDDPALDPALSEPVEDSVYPDVGDPSVDSLHYDLDLAWTPDDPDPRGRRHDRAPLHRATATTSSSTSVRRWRSQSVTLDGDDVDLRAHAARTWS